MISVWYLSAVCCIPYANPAARVREREIFRLVPTFRDSTTRTPRLARSRKSRPARVEA